MTNENILTPNIGNVDGNEHVDVLNHCATIVGPGDLEVVEILDISNSCLVTLNRSLVGYKGKILVNVNIEEVLKII